jgi:hypothetical protein
MGFPAAFEGPGRDAKSANTPKSDATNMPKCPITGHRLNPQATTPISAAQTRRRWRNGPSIEQRELDN